MSASDAIRVRIDELGDLLLPKVGYLTQAGSRLVDTKRAVESMERPDITARLQLAIDIALRDVGVVEAEVEAARLALVQEVQQ